MNNIASFFKEGIFNGISLGMTEEEVKRILGEPENVGALKRDRIIKYKNVQFFFYKELHSIVINFIDLKDNLWKQLSSSTAIIKFKSLLVRTQ